MSETGDNPARDAGSLGRRRVLVVGGTGRTGRLVLRSALAHGLVPVALARDEDRARSILVGDLRQIQITVGDITQPGSLGDAVSDVDSVIFVHGSDGEPSPGSFQRIDYGGVVNVMRAFGERRPRVVLMTTFFVTHRDHYFNDGGHALDWKRRSERFIRFSRAPYTVVRPGWLDNGPAGSHISLQQGDNREAGITRENVAAVLVEALLSEDAVGKTFEAFSGPGAAPNDWPATFASLQSDLPGAIDAFGDTPNLPIVDEPSGVRDDLEPLKTD
ncbi:SDR family oxidoreductase [Arthrobacter sp. NPDC058097]|uniref:SDR family oxidoreductase n=1 Tax=Arthrobacter sp. NPDC058097 TaxID=3346340 RepID=UPI0036DD6391